MTYGAMPDEYLTIPGLPVLTESEILDWYDGPLLFRATGADGSAWFCSSLDVEMTPPGIAWTRCVDSWVYAQHDPATVDDVLTNRRPFRDLYTAALAIWRVDVTWTSRGGPDGQNPPTSTATRSTAETIVDGWLPPADHYYLLTPP